MQCVSVGCTKKIPNSKRHYERYGRYCAMCCTTPVLHQKLGISKDNTNYEKLKEKMDEEMHQPQHIELMI